jgi:hypothetical protein|tara:strand:+ start:1585 stop:2103 length:519 start_codon:yes stop_codon:yes gene_type:complete
MSLKIDDFKAKLSGGGARANYFQVQIPYLQDAGDMMLIKAAALPASIIAPIMVPFRGRQLQIAGDRTFEPWTITIINDSGMAMRAALETWMELIQTNVSNSTASSDPSAYMQDATVTQLKRDGSADRAYNFQGIWPSNISQVDLSYDSENTIEEFTVEFQVTYWTAAAVGSV